MKHLYALKVNRINSAGLVDLRIHVLITAVYNLDAESKALENLKEEVGSQPGFTFEITDARRVCMTQNDVYMQV